MAKKILIVDDDRDVLGVLKGILEGLGYEVEAYSNSDAAQFTLTLESYDLILTDINMPLVSGVELLQYAKTKLHCPVVLISGDPSYKADQERVSSFGADGFISKPFNPTEIEKIVGDLILPAA